MQSVVVSDASCLILLDKINHLELLNKLFGQVIITSIVGEEFGKPLPVYIRIENPKNIVYQNILETILDKGEASSIALALEKEDCLLIIDDQKGRREARLLNVKITGTLGLIALAKEKGLIKSAREILDLIIQTDFRISKSSIENILRKAGE
ncbi:MAG: DUF3368 domain-containing protein [Ignavibacteria bacterium]|nr:DUF3368 domain-containing protein [Ignavibacteria bacterium]